MAFIPPRPSLPSPNRRSAMVRPSGDVVPQEVRWNPGSTSDSITIANMPRDASVFIDGEPLSIGGAGWEGTTAHFPLSNSFSALRVVSPSQGTKGFTGQWHGATDAFDWLELPVISGPTAVADVGAAVGAAWVRITSPHAEVRVDGGLLSGSSSTGGVRRYEVPSGPGHVVEVTGPGPDFERYVFPVDIGGDQMQTLNLIPAAMRTAFSEPYRPPSGSIALLGVPSTWATLLDGVIVAPSALGNVLVGRHDVGTRPPAGRGGDIIRSVAVTAGMTATANLTLEVAARIAPAMGTLRVTGTPGWLVGLAMPSLPDQIIDDPVVIPPGGRIALPISPGTYILGARNAEGRMERQPVSIIANETTERDVREWFTTVATTSLTVTGAPGWTVAIANVGSRVPLRQPVILPPSGTIRVEGWPVGDYDLAVDDHAGHAVGQTIQVKAPGTTIHLREWIPAVDLPGPTGGAPPRDPPPSERPPTAFNVTITGTPTWRVTLTPTAPASAAPPLTTLGPLPILRMASGSGAVGLSVRPGTYTLAVERAPGDVQSRPLTVERDTPVDVSGYFNGRMSQGPTTASTTTGEVWLQGAPPQSIVTVPAASITYAVNDSGRPVALDLPPGTYAVVVTPAGANSTPRTSSVTVVAGARSAVEYGMMTTQGRLVTDPNTGLQVVQTVDEMCGPIVARPAWATATACPGATLTAPDGSRYAVTLAPAPTVGVVLTLLKADGTPAGMPTIGGWSNGEVAMALGGLIAVAGVGYYAWQSSAKSKGGKQENPSKKCSCQSH